MGIEEKTYREFVRELIRTKSTAITDNGKEAHTKIWYQEFLFSAVSRVNIFCHQLRESIFEDVDVLRALNVALENGVTVRVLLQRPSPQAKKFAEALGQDNIRFTEDQKDMQQHFTTMDSRGIRFEPNKEEKGKNCKAIVSASQPELATKLDDFFESAWKNAVSAEH